VKWHLTRPDWNRTPRFRGGLGDVDDVAWDSAVQPVGEVADKPGMLTETSSSRSSPAPRSGGIKIDVSNVADANPMSLMRRTHANAIRHDRKRQRRDDQSGMRRVSHRLPRYGIPLSLSGWTIGDLRDSRRNR
jgi:hypothetical protein